MGLYSWNVQEDTTALESARGLTASVSFKAQSPLFEKLRAGNHTSRSLTRSKRRVTLPHMTASFVMYC
jgi:hypothetical protein